MRAISGIRRDCNNIGFKIYKDIIRIVFLRKEYFWNIEVS